MKLKSVAMMFLCVITLFSGLLLVGCSDKYAGLSIKVDKTEIALKIGDDSIVDTDSGAAVSSASAVIKATLSGASADMTRGMSFRFDDPSIVTSAIIGSDGDTNFVQVTAATAGTTNMYIVSNELGTVLSQPIKVSVYRNADTMTFDSAQKPSVEVGGSLDLNASDILQFAVGGEAVKIYPSTADFTLLSPSDARWNTAYGSAIPAGVTITQNVLSATPDAKCGIVQVLATRGSLRTVCYIMVYRSIDADASISLYQNDTLVKDDVRSIINPIEQNANRMVLVPRMDDASQNYQMRIVSANSDILLVGAPNASGQINAIVCNSGETTLDVIADIVDPYTGDVYQSFVKTYHVKINRIVTAISVYSSDVEPTTEPASMTVQDAYVNGVLGKKVHFNVYPDNDENSGAIASTDVVLAVTQIDGQEGEYSTEDFADVVVYVGDKPYTWGDAIKNDSDIYVSLGKTNQISRSFRLAFLANTFDTSLPVASNYIDFEIQIGVTRIETSTDYILLGEGMTADFELTYFDKQSNAMTGAPVFSFNTSALFSITDKGEYEYTVTAHAAGDTQIVVTAESGAVAEITLAVRTILTSMGLTLASSESILETTDATPNPDDEVVDNGIQSVTIAVGGEIDLGYRLNPVATDSSSFWISSVVSSDINGSYISVAREFSDGKLHVNALAPTQMDSDIMLTITFVHYVVSGDNVQRTESYRMLSIRVYQPLKYMYWAGTASQQTITQQVVNIAKLGYADIADGTLSLEVKYDDTASYFVNGGHIVWTVDDETRVTLTSVEEESDSQMLIQARLPDTDTAKYYTVNITAMVQEYSVTYLLTCILTIQNPSKVAKINMLNYYDEYYGIRLNDLGTSKRTQYELSLSVEPSDAYNTNLRYVVINKQNVGDTDERVSEVASADAIITLDSQNPNIIRAVAGKSGSCYIRVFPEDALLTADMTFADVTLYLDIYVVVEDGEENAYTIYEPLEFVAIGSSSLAMTKNYILMNSIDVSAYSSGVFPLGDDTPFSGTISTRGGQALSISGLPVVTNVVTKESNSYVGVFSQILSESETPVISNISFYFDNGSIDLAVNQSQMGSTVYSGLLAGRIEGDLQDVFVGYVNYRTNKIVLNQLSSAVDALYFGAVAGEYVGSGSGVSVNIAVNINSVPLSTRLMVGGVAGKYTGGMFGQDEDLNCNVNIVVSYSTSSENAKKEIADKVAGVLASSASVEGVGGLFGIAEGATSSMVYAMQVTGSVSAPGTINVGGFVGLNKLSLGKKTNSSGKIILSKNLAAVRVQGAANVGGFVGANYGYIDYAVAEIYDTANSLDADSITWVNGIYRVGGFAGYADASSRMSYSYAMSYVNRTMVSKDSDVSDVTFWGDILGVAEVGGFVGYAAGVIKNSYAYTQIQQYNYVDHAVLTALPKYTGGFAGKFVSTGSNSINYSFAIGSILGAGTAADEVYGEYAGYYSAEASKMIYQVYAYVDITVGGAQIYTLIGSHVSGTTAECFFAVKESTAETKQNGGYTYEELRLKNSLTSIYNTEGVANWGFTAPLLVQQGYGWQEWVAWDDSISGLNKDLPILYDDDGAMLYNQAITHISVTPNSYRAEGSSLYTYWGYTYTTAPDDTQMQGAVVLLDNVTEVDNLGRPKISITELFSVSVTPQNLSKSKWKISVTSSDFGIVEVEQPKQNLSGANLIFKNCGVVTIRFASLLNKNVYTEIQINVIGGFDTFCISDSKGNNMTADGYVMNIKAGRDTGYPVYASFGQRQDREYITQMGLIYTTQDTDFVSFAGVNYDGFSAYIPAEMTAILSGNKAKSDNIMFSVKPYVMLSFGGQTYRYSFDELSKSFWVKVYEGISSVDVYTGIEANMPSGSEVYMSVDVMTDNVDTVELTSAELERISIQFAGVSEHNFDQFAKLISTQVLKVASTHPFSCYLDGVEVLDRQQIAEVIERVIAGENLDAYVMIDSTRYDTQEELRAYRDYLITNCVRYTYIVSLKGEYKYITQNAQLSFKFTISDTGSGDKYTVRDTVTFIPASISKLELKHFTYGADSMEMGEAASNSLSPGTSGVLRIDITPDHALYDYAIINSVALSGTSPILLQQMVYKNGVYRYLSQSAEYDASGNMILRKVTGINSAGEEYFDGRIFVSTLIVSGVAEGSRYSISVAPMRDGVQSPVFEAQTIYLTAAFAPFATLELDSEYDANIVARGTVAYLRLTGILQNSTISLSSSYYSALNGSRLTNCAFDTRKIQYSFVTGERENVDMLIPFYIGLDARPDYGKITLSVTIDSYTELGGRLSPLIITCVINVVDYIVDSTYTRGTQTGNLQISVDSYTPLIALFEIEQPKWADFGTYIGFSSDETQLNDEKEKFTELLDDLKSTQTQKQKLLNALGEGAGGVWWYDDGSGYTQLNNVRSYLDFWILFDTVASQDCYKIRGRDLQTDFLLRLSYETTYVYDEEIGCYRFILVDEINSSDSNINQNDLLDDYVRKLEQDFYADLTEQSDEDNPFPIYTADELRTAMVTGGNYMLLSDIELYDWQPLDTAIGSLDGNGYIIYLRSFADTTSTTSANYGLFGTLAEGSVLKNLIIDVSYNINIDLTQIAKVNFGFVAGVNNGIIYNCDIVVTKDKTTWENDIYKSTPDITTDNADEQFGRNIFKKILNGDEEYAGCDTLASTFVMTSKTVNSQAVSATIGGLVGTNGETGSITNCRVGRVSDDPLGTSQTRASGALFASQGLNLFASGTVGGLVGENSGVISNSYFANGYIVNSLMDVYSATNTDGARTGGLVAVQNSGGRIFGSFARGLLQKDSARSLLGGVIAYGSIGGLVHSNSGVISNSYSNLNLSSASGMGGFVYENLSGGRIGQCYSLSRVQTQGLINGVFVGVDYEGNLLDSAQAVVQNCFYLTETGIIVDSAERALPLSQENWQDTTGALFEGFVISADESGESTWYYDTTRSYLGPQLRLADRVMVSSRTTIGEDANYVRGTKKNPLLITSLASWQNRIFNYQSQTHKSQYLSTHELNSSTKPYYKYGDAYIMLLVDIDFDGAIDATTSKMIFGGHLYGNGHVISGIDFTQSVTDLETRNDFGLFAELRDATVSNISLVLEQSLTTRASHVGVLAGTISDSWIENITITGSTSTASVTGTNMVGALAGLITGDSQIYNIEANLSIAANAATIEKRAYSYYNPSTKYATGISYAGGVIGVLDLDVSEDGDNTATPRVRNITMHNTVYVAGTAHNISIDLAGEIVGGIVGLLGTNSEMYQAQFEVREDAGSSYIRGRNFTGGLVGENRGVLLNSRLSRPIDEQVESDSQILASDSPSSYVGTRTLFASEASSNAVGGLVGLNIGGSISYSYNRVAVINTRARVAGGLIGLAIDAPDSFDTSSSDPVLSYLRNINVNKATLLAPVSGGVEYQVSAGIISPTDNTIALSYGAALLEVYTTAMVDASEAIGGLVGAQLNAPIYTYSSTQVVSAMAYDQRDSTYIAKATTDSVYMGSATGYLGLNYASTPVATQVVAYIRDTRSGVASQNLKVTTTLGSSVIQPIGNVLGALSDVVTSTSFVSAATSSEDKPFANFDSKVWNLDNDKLEHRFPYLRSEYDSPIKDITTVDEFFEELISTRGNSHYRITKDLTITGARWQQFYENSGRYSLGTEQSPVRGKLEGQVSVLVNGRLSTRAAQITFTNFNTEQMRYYHSLFGYTNSFKLSNINFVYEFDFDVTQLGGQKEFALLMLSTNATSLNNVGVTLATQNEDETVTKNSLILVNNEGACKIQKLALVAARSYNSTFNNIYFDAKIKVGDLALATDDDVTKEFDMGAIVALATGTLSIGGVDMGRVDVEYSSQNDYQLYVGALAGRASGVVNLAGSVNSIGNIRGSVAVSSAGVLPVYVGGVLGWSANSVNLRDFTTDVDITFVRDNSSSTVSHEYVGGICGALADSNINGAHVLGDITVTGGNGELYLGGVAGQNTTTHTFANAHTGYTTQNSSARGKISVDSYTTTDTAGQELRREYSTIWVGGIYGLTTERISMQNGYTEPVSDAISVYDALYSAVDFELNVAATYIYAGGVIGRATQGIVTLDESSEAESPSYVFSSFTRPNVVLRITNCGFVGDLVVYNTKTSSGTDYLGGLVGTSELLVQDAYSDGAISYTSQTAEPVYLGGIVAYAKNHIFGAVSWTVMNYSCPNEGTEEKVFCDPIATVADLSDQGKRVAISVSNVYSSPQLNGVYSQFGSNATLGALDAFSPQTAALIVANMSNWISREIVYPDGTTLAAVMPTALVSMADLSIGGEIAPVIITDYADIVDIIQGSAAHQTIFLGGDVEVANSQMSLAAHNIRRLIGDGHSLVLADWSATVTEGSAVGLFGSIPNNMLISSLGIRFGSMTFAANGETYIGVLAGTNYGTIYDVSIGGLPQIDEGYLGSVSSQQKTVATFSDGAADRYFGSTIDSREIATMTVVLESGSSVVGGMFGTSQGVITNSFVSLDISVTGGGSSYVGGLVGAMPEGGVIDNVAINGRLNLETLGIFGGIVGTAQKAIVTGIVTNVNMTIPQLDDENTVAGLDFGKFSLGTRLGVIVNTNISATELNWEDDETEQRFGLSTAEMSSDIAMQRLNESAGFRHDIWAQDKLHNYGYPRLQGISNIDFDTGDGSSQNPYQFAEAAQLLDLENALGEINYCLTRDMVLSPENYAELSRIVLSATELNGMGHTIVIYQLPEFDDDDADDVELSIGLFREIKKDTVVRNLGVAISDSVACDAERRIFFGSLAVRNFGTITNCYAICNDADYQYHSGTVTFAASLGDSYIGGLVSQNYGTISSSWAKVNFEGLAGHFGGIAGVQGRAAIQNPDGSTTAVKQATMQNCFASGSIYLRGPASDDTATSTSIGGLVGKNMSYLSSGYVIKDCYVSGARLGALYAGLNVGMLIGYNVSQNDLGQNIFNTYRTYAYVATDTTPVNGKATGNYLDMGMVGNQAAVQNKDTTSCFALAYYVPGQKNLYSADEMYRQLANDSDVATLTWPGSKTKYGLKGYEIGNGIYTGWAQSSWCRHIGVSYNGTLLYLDKVTPTFLQDGSSGQPFSDDAIFELVY